jgi:hypothetical protein
VDYLSLASPEHLKYFDALHLFLFLALLPLALDTTLLHPLGVSSSVQGGLATKRYAQETVASKTSDASDSAGAIILHCGLLVMVYNSELRLLEIVGYPNESKTPERIVLSPVRWIHRLASCLILIFRLNSFWVGYVLSAATYL